MTGFYERQCMTKNKLLADFLGTNQKYRDNTVKSNIYKFPMFTHLRWDDVKEQNIQSDTYTPTLLHFDRDIAWLNQVIFRLNKLGFSVHQVNVRGVIIEKTERTSADILTGGGDSDVELIFNGFEEPYSKLSHLRCLHEALYQFVSKYVAVLTDEQVHALYSTDIMSEEILLPHPQSTSEVSDESEAGSEEIEEIKVRVDVEYPSGVDMPSTEFTISKTQPFTAPDPEVENEMNIEGELHYKEAFIAYVTPLDINSTECGGDCANCELTDESCCLDVTEE